MNNLVIIFGFGKFGKIAFEHFKSFYNCLLIDPTFNKNANTIKDDIEFFNDIDEFIKAIKIRENNKESKINCSLKGSVREVSAILMNIIPKFLIPTAPIHVMAETIKEMYSEQLFEPNILQPDFESFLINQLKDCPKNLNIFNQNFKHIYYSYADKEELCPDNCLGPLDYCPNFQKEKPVTVSEFVKKAFEPNGENKLRNSKYGAVCFESMQIIPGLGGLESTELINGLQLTKDLLIQNQSLEKIIISTTCNCHGVSTIYDIIRES